MATSNDFLYNTDIHWPKSLWQDLEGNFYLVTHLDRAYYYYDIGNGYYLSKINPKRDLLYVTKF